MESKDTLAEANTNGAVGLIAGEEHGRKVVALTAAIKREDDGLPFRILESGNIQIVERLCGQPTFRRGEVTFYEALSFSRFVKRFRNSTSVIFADAYFAGTPTGPRFTAVLDYHPDGPEQNTAQWDLFRAYLPLRHTPAWTTWAGVNGKAMEQAVFAQHLEDNLPNIAEPSGALLVEIARTLEATTDVSWQSHIRADNGAHRFAFLETINGSAATKDGKIEIPAEFTLVLQPFEGSKEYAVKARLRYRLAQGSVKLWFDIVRLQDVLKEAFNDELLKIQTEVGDETPIYNGPAPAPQQPKE